MDVFMKRLLNCQPHRMSGIWEGQGSGRLKMTGGGDGGGRSPEAGAAQSLRVRLERDETDCF